MEARLATPSVRADVTSLGLKSVEQLLLLERWLAPEMFPGSEYQTLLQPRLAYRAGKDFFLGADVLLDQLLLVEHNGPWVRRQADSSLLKTWLQQAPDRAAALRSVVRSACRLTEPAFFAEWQSASRTCRQGLAALAVDGELGPAEGMSAEDIEVLRGLAGRSPGTLPLTVRNIDRVIRLFATYDSILLHLSAERLLAAVPCRTARDVPGIACRSELLRALTWTNHGRLAARELEALQRDAGDTLNPEARHSLRRLVTEALRAEEGPADS
jgi:hypothetical protein